MPKEKDKFVFLDDDAKDLLESDQNVHLAYVDLLSLLNDLLISHGSTPLHPHFKVGQIMLELDNVVHAFPSGQAIGAVARKNIEVANNLSRLSKSSASSATSGGKATPLQAAVNSFLTDLLEEYDSIRNIRSRGGVMRC